MGLNDIAGLRDALNLKRALVQTDSYLFGTPTEETQGKAKLLDKSLPVVTANGRGFVRNIFKDKDRVAMVKESVKLGTIIEYKVNQNLSKFGVVTKHPDKSPLPKAIYVDPISSKAAAQLLRDNPEVVQLTLTQGNTITDPTFASLNEPKNLGDYFIDPLDRLLFKIHSTYLGRMVGIFDTDQVFMRELILGVIFAMACTICIFLVALR
jgi:hypothetical protein